MSLPLKLISTDFDGTLHAEHEDPPVPKALETLIARLQQQGAQWVINTGRDLSSLMETLARAHLRIKPDWIVTVEREIHFHEGSRYVPLEPWNSDCERRHRELFATLEAECQQLFDWVNGRFNASVYADPYSPFCLIAENIEDATTIRAHLEAFAERIPGLTVVHNDVYARFSHADYSKGTALAEIARRLGVRAEETLAAGDHWNDLPMLQRQHARWLVTPRNAIPVVQETVRRQGGIVSEDRFGHGVAEGIRRVLQELGFADVG